MGLHAIPKARQVNERLVYRIDVEARGIAVQDFDYAAAKVAVYVEWTSSGNEMMVAVAADARV